jgi:predicted metal-binding membrane protein
MPGNDWLRLGLGRQRAAILASLGLLCVLAWLYLLSGAGMDTAAGGSMEDMVMARAPAPAGPLAFALALAMWWIMMIAMMLPSAAPAVLLYSRVHDHAVATASGPTPADVMIFVSGYLICWFGFSLLAAGLQLALASKAILSPIDLALGSRWAAGAVLIAAGLYQWSPMKSACLGHCRSPAHYFARHWRPGVTGALLLGLRHGAFCVGCCWALMLLLFAGGIMNMIWVVVLALLVMAEKLLPWDKAVARAGGLILILLGATYMATGTTV